MPAEAREETAARSLNSSSDFYRNKGKAMNNMIRSTSLIAMTAFGMSLALAGPVAAEPTSEQLDRPSSAATQAPDKVEIPIEMNVQENDMWCWAAAGTTIAAHHGKQISQTEFCQHVHGGEGQNCPNEGAWLGDVQPVFKELGFASPGTATGKISYEEVQKELSSDRPIATDIHWTSGGGHIQVLYGYDKAKNMIAYGDPGPESERYNWATYEYYSNNDTFSWENSLVGVDN